MVQEEYAQYQEQQIGEVIHYWDRPGVAGVHLTGPLKVGDRIHIKGHTSDFQEDVRSIQIDHQNVERADKGDEIGIPVHEHAREHDKVYKLVSSADVGTGKIF